MGNDKCYEEDEMGHYDRNWLRDRLVSREDIGGETCTMRRQPEKSLRSRRNSRCQSFELGTSLLCEEQKEGLCGWMSGNGGNSGRRWGWKDRQRFYSQRMGEPPEGFTQASAVICTLRKTPFADVWRMQSLLGGKVEEIIVAKTKKRRRKSGYGAWGHVCLSFCYHSSRSHEYC